MPRASSPYMDVWLDVAAGAMRSLEPHRTVAGKIADGYLGWVAERLEPETDGNPSRSAALVVAAIEGMYLLKAIGRPALANDAMTALSAPVGLSS